VIVQHRTLATLLKAIGVVEGDAYLLIELSILIASGD